MRLMGILVLFATLLFFVATTAFAQVPLKADSQQSEQPTQQQKDQIRNELKVVVDSWTNSARTRISGVFLIFSICCRWL